MSDCAVGPDSKLLDAKDIYTTHVFTQLMNKRFVFGLLICIWVWFVVRTTYEPEPDCFGPNQ